MAAQDTQQPEIRSQYSSLQGALSPQPLQNPPAGHASPTAAVPAAGRQDLSKCEMIYPLTPAERMLFRTSDDKVIPPHHWAVYDMIRHIPAGKVSTYKDVCAALGEGSPRSVGAALRGNPFSPFIPCHRVIASNLFVGGFKGEWLDARYARSDSTTEGDKDVPTQAQVKEQKMGALQQEKIQMLLSEGVAFEANGKLAGGQDVLWKFSSQEKVQ
ncbi:6-O-methylguanine DNA methyltransferase [Gloeopeniophorella convolvens]|nr:6-O-methylguanine DNA methyltransferase [Gloeopeniophorella convolvens]